jgi:CBASS immunity sensor of nucleotide second messenger signals
MTTICCIVPTPGWESYSLNSFMILTPWETIGNIANILQIITAIPVFLAAAYYILYRRRINKAIADLNRGGGQKPAALAVDCKGGSILVQTRDYLRQQDINIQPSMIQEYLRKSVTPETAQTYLRELREVRDRMIGEGVTELHLFFRGPIALAIGVGAIFDSVFPVHVYQFAQTPETSQPPYEYWMTLHQGEIAGMPPSRVERALEIAGRIA